MLPVAISQLVLALACGSLGVRLLLVYRRSRGLPELLLGVALLAIITCVPLLAVSGLGRGLVDTLRFAPLMLGLALLSLSTISMSAFAWRTFRPETRWGRLFVAAVGAAQLTTAIGAALQLAATPDGVESIAAAPGWLVAVRVPAVVNFGWTGIEAFRQWRMARRRRAAVIAIAGLVSSALLWLVFMPPACYRAWVIRRAAIEAA